MGTHYRTCPLCEAMCGLAIDVDGDRVVRVRGDRDDVWSKGFLCPKGATIGQLHADPDRLRAPMVRTGPGRGELREATWDDAFRRCEELLHGVVERHGIGSVHAYLGNPNAHSYSLTRYSGAVIGMAGVTNIWSAGTVDQWPKNLVCAQLYGGAWTIPIPDVAHTDLFVIMGANPHASNGSILSFPDLVGELGRLRARGGRSVVVDPRRTGTAVAADEWIGIRPGTDAALLLAVVHELEPLGAVRPSPRVQGVDDVLAAARRYPPERVADWCGVPAARIRDLAGALAAAERPVVYGRIGLCNQEFGTLASWLVEVVNVLLGRLDAVGGARFPRPALALIAETSRRRGPLRTGRWTSRVRGAPEVIGQFPLSCLAEEIDTPGEGQVKALLTVAGNPVLSAPDAGRLDAALPMLEAMVCVDNYLNETTRHADVILPGLSPLEQPHCDEPIWGFALRAVARWSPAIFEVGERPDEWEVCLLLGSILAGMKYSEVDVAAMDDAYFAGRAARHGLEPSVVAAGLRGPDRIVDLTYRAAPFGLTLEEVQRHPHGLDLGESCAGLDDVLRTDSGDVELAHDVFLADLPRLDAAMDAPRSALVLIGRRHVRSNNSWMHNLPGLMKGKDRSGLLIHPSDAAAHGVVDGGAVRLTTSAGSVETVAAVSDELVPGVVSLPHGWGHGLPGARLSVAAKHPGVNTNVLIPPDAVDVPSGNAAVNGVPVEITPI